MKEEVQCLKALCGCFLPLLCSALLPSLNQPAAPTEEEVLQDMDGVMNKVDHAISERETFYGAFPTKENKAFLPSKESIRRSKDYKLVIHQKTILEAEGEAARSKKMRKSSAISGLI